jgi:outer membrane protein OmpA-like peptidoglycan-associated protein
MIDRRDDEAFWPSYVDLMTSLFVVALVLFVFSYAALTAEREKLRAERDRYKISADSYRRLQDIEGTIRELADREHFTYQPQFKRYVFTRDVQFKKGDDTIDASYYEFLRETGNAISNLVERLKADPAKRDAKYLIIIEGMASKDNYQDNFGLSYKRALSLYSFWKRENIVFDPDVCEILIAGSGTEGVGRYGGDQESRNQRFLIQIIPKVAYQK